VRDRGFVKLGRARQWVSSVIGLEARYRTGDPQVVMCEYEHEDLKFVAVGNVELVNIHARIMLRSPLSS
jgi:hypothetical protein